MTKKTFLTVKEKARVARGKISGPRGPNKPGNLTRIFTEERRQKYFNCLQETGEAGLARTEVGISYQSILIHRQKTPNFAESEEEAMRQYRARIGQEIHRRGVEGVEEPIIYNGKVIGWVTKYSDRLLLEHAKRHVPEYRDKISIDQTTKGVLAVGLADLSKLNPDSREDLRRILERERDEKE